MPCSTVSRHREVPYSTAVERTETYLIDGHVTMCHQSDLERISILHVALNEEHLHELRLHTMVFP